MSLFIQQNSKNNKKNVKVPITSDSESPLNEISSKENNENAKESKPGSWRPMPPYTTEEKEIILNQCRLLFRYFKTKPFLKKGIINLDFFDTFFINFKMVAMLCDLPSIIKFSESG